MDKVDKADKNNNGPSKSSKGICIGLAIFLIVVVIIYLFILFETYKKSTFIFQPYVPPTIPDNFFYPLGSVTVLTQDQIDQRNSLITGTTA